MNSQGSTAIQAFVFPVTNQQIRITDRNGKFWYVRNDVCWALGHKNPRQATATHCKPEGVQNLDILTEGGVQKVVIINEPNLNRLIMRSNVEHALRFQDWVCEEVLPSIRKTGAYGHNSQQQFDPHNLDPDVMLEALINVQQLRKEEKARQLELENKLAAQTPVVHAYKRLAATEGSMNITEAAKNLKIPPTELTNYMLEAEWLYMRPSSTRKIAFQKKIDRGWMESEPFSKDLGNGRTYINSQPKVTGAGLLRLAIELNIVLTEPPQ